MNNETTQPQAVDVSGEKELAVKASGSEGEGSGSVGQNPASTEVWWAAHEDSESWHCADSLEEALATGLEWGYDTIWAGGSSEEIAPECLIDSRDYFENFQDSLENCPNDEGWEEWWGVKPEVFAELDEMWREAFCRWRDKHNLPRYYRIDTSGARRYELAASPAQAPGTQQADQKEESQDVH